MTFFLFLFYVLPPAEILKLLSFISFKNFLIASLFYGLSHIVRGLRWSVLLKELSFFQTFLINSANVFLNNLLPARTGELSWFYYSKKLGVSLQRSLRVFLWGRLLDLFSLIILLTFFYALYKSSPSFYLLSVFFLLLSLLLYLPLSVGANFTTSAIACTLSLLSGLFKFSSLMALMGAKPSVGLFLSFLGGELSTVFPIHSFGGFGTYELSFSLPQKLMGESLKDGLKLAFVFHSFLLISSAFYGLIAVFILHSKARNASYV